MSNKKIEENVNITCVVFYLGKIIVFLYIKFIMKQTTMIIIILFTICLFLLYDTQRTEKFTQIKFPSAKDLIQIFGIPDGEERHESVTKAVNFMIQSYEDKGMIPPTDIIISENKITMGNDRLVFINKIRQYFVELTQTENTKQMIENDNKIISHLEKLLSNKPITTTLHLNLKDNPVNNSTQKTETETESETESDDPPDVSDSDDIKLSNAEVSGDIQISGLETEEPQKVNTSIINGTTVDTVEAFRGWGY